MSIYATHWILKFPRYGDAHSGCEWIEVIGQGVPAHPRHSGSSAKATPERDERFDSNLSHTTPRHTIDDHGPKDP